MLNATSRAGALANALRARRVVIDFSSPNIAKPFHFGHLKSTILGNFLANLEKHYGAEVTKLNYVGDWGTQYGLLSLGLDKLESSEVESMESPLRFLLDTYVKANERGKEDEEFYKKARQRFTSLDLDKNSEHLKKWQTVRDLSLKELNASYRELNIEFDTFECESEYAQKSIDLFASQRATSMDFIKKLEDGPLVAEVEKNKKPLQVPLLKSDGSSLYLSRDVAAALARKERYNFDQMLYVVGANQEKHFHCLREIIRKLGYSWADNMQHVKIGKVVGMSSRSGNFVLLSDIIAEATRRYIEATRQVVTSKVSEQIDLETVGKNLALSALFVYDLRHSRTVDYHFKWDQVMEPNRGSGIHLQTTYARLCSLHRRAAERGLHPIGGCQDLANLPLDCYEAEELKDLLRKFDTALEESRERMDACPLLNHALELCKAINRARRSPNLIVIHEEDSEIALQRLTLFGFARSQLELIIKLIGLRPLERV